MLNTTTCAKYRTQKIDGQYRTVAFTQTFDVHLDHTTVRVYVPAEETEQNMIHNITVARNYASLQTSYSAPLADELRSSDTHFFKVVSFLEHCPYGNVFSYYLETICGYVVETIF